MPDYYVNKNAQSNGDHEVHRTDEVGCRNPAASYNREDLGWHMTCHGAVAEAQRRHPIWRVNGCYYCCYACHTT